MNFISPAPVRIQEGRALLSLSQTQRRLAWKYRNWALEAESAGKLDDYRKWRAESDRLWSGAKWHLNKAREHFNG